MDAQSTIPLSSANRMPVLGLGTWELTHHTADTVKRALQLGYRLIDTACDYGSQPGIGEAIRSAFVERSSIYLVAKVEETDDAYEATRKYLSDIGVDYADLMLIHRPPDTGVGEELWRGLARARQEGLTRDIGVSNYDVEQIERLSEKVGEQPAVNQIEWTPFGHSERMLDFCCSNHIVIQAYSPLTRAERLDEPVLKKIAAQHEKTSAQVLIRWNLQLGTVPLPKANLLAHLEENFAVFDFELSDEQMNRLSELNQSYSALGSLSYA
jgi:2,5-diketo-D-gluconate reductase A